jgi:uncharacterized protein (DUF3084 family)
MHARVGPACVGRDRDWTQALCPERRGTKKAPTSRVEEPEEQNGRLVARITALGAENVQLKAWAVGLECENNKLKDQVKTLEEESARLNARMKKGQEENRKLQDKIKELEAMSSTAEANGRIPHKELRRLIAVCHPDRWNNHPVATALTKELTALLSNPKKRHASD